MIRTDLANERTLLAYGRTALAMIAAGAGVAHLFRQPWVVAAGWVLLGLGVSVLAGGIVRFAAVRRRIGPRDPERDA